MSTCIQILNPFEVGKNSNFVPLLPEKLPDDCNLFANQGKYRPELPPKRFSDHPTGNCWSNWSGAHTQSWSFEIVGKNRKIRCKQFLYDLGPLSTLDHAALYDYFPDRMKSFNVDSDRVAWFGIDYANRPALSALAWGTNIEFRIVQGDFTEVELMDLFMSTRPSSDGSLNTIQKPFSALSYWARYPRYDLNMCSTSYKPPSSFWKIRWPWAPSDHQWHSRDSG